MNESIRQRAFVSVYLILRRNNEILFLLRKNTGYCDGLYGLVAGHVDEGEGAITAMVREAKEEAGIEILPDRLKPVHIMHRSEKRNNVDIFFECSDWRGAICNREPEKCEALQFFSLDALPANSIEYIRRALKDISRGKFFSEFGWA